MKKGEDHKRIDDIVLAALAGGTNLRYPDILLISRYVLLEGSLEKNKKMDKRNENGEHHERIYGILEYIFFI